MDPLDADLASFLTHDRFVRSLARSLVRDSSTLDDVVQETWWAAIRKRPDPDQPLRPWLARVARNFALKLRRGEARRHEREIAAAVPEALPSTAALVEREAARRSVVDAVLALPEPMRGTVVLRYFDGLPPRAIALRTGEPVAAVKSRLKRALAILRTKLSPSDPEKCASFGASLVALAATPRGGTLATAAATTKTILLGAFAMSTGAKLATAAAAVIVLLFAAWPFLPSQPASNELATQPVIEASGDSSPTNPSGPAPASVRITPRPVEAESAPTTRSSTAPATGSLAVRVRYADGAPAADVAVGVRYQDRSDWVDAAGIERRTDLSGTVVFENVPAGRVYPGADRGGRQSVSMIKAGERTETTINLEAGVEVEGIVVDDLGVAVPGAEIILDHGLNRPGGQRVATSVQDGTFRVWGIQTAMGIGARAENHAPSVVFMLSTNKNDLRPHEHVKLVCPRGGAVVVGRVVGPDDQPVAGAIVFLGEEVHALFAVSLEDGARGVIPTSFVARTDAQGRFRFPSLPERLLPVAARASGFALWRGSISPASGEGASILIRLDRGARLSGVVTDEKDRPVARALLQVGRLWGLFEASATLTDDSGAYAFDHLAAGEINIVAEKFEKRAQTTLVMRSGEETVWDPVLSSGLVLQGRVVDEAGLPRPSRLHLTRDDPGRAWVGRQAWAFADGRFEFTNVEDVPHRIVVEWPGRDQGGAELVALPGVRPGAADVVVVAPSDVRGVGLVGRVVDAAGKPLADVPVTAMSVEGGQGAPKTTDSSGKFAFAEMMPGRFRVEARARGYPVFTTPEKLLASGSSWDVGTIELKAGGRLEAKVRRMDGSPVGMPYLDVRGLDREISLGLSVKDGAGVVPQILPGRYELHRSTADPSPIPFQIVAGETTALDVVLDPGVVRVLRIKDDGAQTSGLIHVVVKYQSRLCDEYFTRRGSEPLECALALDPGSYDVEITADSGRSAKTALVVADRSSPKEIVDVVLK